MLYSVRGKLIHMEANLAVVECAGVGYALKTTANTMSRQPEIGGETTLYTHLYVREDAVELFGFATLSELNCFQMLISVSGVGPKAALSILSNVTPEQFALCVATGDSKVFTASKGIGLKTAQRIVLELKDKITKEQLEGGVAASNPVLAGGVSSGKGNLSEAVSALVVLGYSQQQAARAVTAFDAALPVEELIKLALKALAG
ncbi:MAG: Holliday junction branch migration protein RuvA [Oscillospiraceae bacterium]|nr:Holliday junction branch migration protein RuvA [Oscillospiraceae bacterium]